MSSGPVDPNSVSNRAFVGHSFNSHVYGKKPNENTNHDNPSHAHSFEWRTLENKILHRSFYLLFFLLSSTVELWSLFEFDIPTDIWSHVLNMKSHYEHVK